MTGAEEGPPPVERAACAAEQSLRPYTRFIGWADRGFWRNAGAAAASQDVVARFGQAMYTPKDSTHGEVIESDPPYARPLYPGMAWNRRIHPKVPATRCSTHASSRSA